MSPYRLIEHEARSCACPKVVTAHVLAIGAKRVGPFAVGYVRWGLELYRVWSTPWFSFWFRTK